MSVQSVLARIAEIDQSLVAPTQQAPSTSFQATLGAQTDTATPLNATPGLTSAGFTPAGTGATAGGGTQAMLQAAAGEGGQTAQPPGSNDSPRIAQYRQATAGAGVGPWCAYFASWAARQAGMPLGEQGQ